MFCSGNVLTDADYPDDLAVHVAPGGRIQQHIDPLTTFCVQWKLIVGGLNAEQGVVKHALYRRLVLIGNEVTNQVSPQYFRFLKPGDLRGCLVPLVNEPVRINTENRRVRRINKLY